MGMTQHGIWHVMLGRNAELLLSIVRILGAFNPWFLLHQSQELGFQGVSPGAGLSRNLQLEEQRPQPTPPWNLTISLVLEL